MRTFWSGIAFIVTSVVDISAQTPSPVEIIKSRLQKDGNIEKCINVAAATYGPGGDGNGAAHAGDTSCGVQTNHSGAWITIKLSQGSEAITASISSAYRIIKIEQMKNGHIASAPFPNLKVKKDLHNTLTRAGDLADTFKKAAQKVQLRAAKRAADAERKAQGKHKINPISRPDKHPKILPSANNP